MAKTFFVAFPIEDERQRDLLKEQSIKTRSPFEYIDISVKDPYDTKRKDKVRTRIKKSEGKKVLSIWACTNDRINVESVRSVPWASEANKNFTDSI